MSSFICEHCGAQIIDTDRGYITGCEHYPVGKIIPIAPAIKRRVEEQRRALFELLREMNSQ